MSRRQFTNSIVVSGVSESSNPWELDAQSSKRRQTFQSEEAVFLQPPQQQDDEGIIFVGFVKRNRHLSYSKVKKAVLQSVRFNNVVEIIIQPSPFIPRPVLQRQIPIHSSRFGFSTDLSAC
jgi:hypothetical protein